VDLFTQNQTILKYSRSPYTSVQDEWK